MKAGHLGVGEEGVRPPDAAEHLVADAQLVLVARAGKVESRVVPVLPEVEIHREVLQRCQYRMISVGAGGGHFWRGKLGNSPRFTLSANQCDFPSQPAAFTNRYDPLINTANISLAVL